MKKILVIALCVAAPAFAGEDDAIKPLFTQLDACIAKKDAQCIGQLLTTDATVASPGLVDSMNVPKIFKSRAEAIDAFEKLMKDMPPDSGAKQRHVVRNVHLIGSDRAFVDCQVELSGVKEKPPGDYHAVGSLIRQDGKWLIQDMRSFVVTRPAPPPAANAPKADEAAAAAQAGTPATPAAPAPDDAPAGP